MNSKFVHNLNYKNDTFESFLYNSFSIQSKKIDKISCYKFFKYFAVYFFVNFNKDFSNAFIFSLWILIKLKQQCFIRINLV